ncbi:MAG: hypothetical protein AB7U05_09010 [Mangrovibacterium sp.]
MTDEKKVGMLKHEFAQLAEIPFRTLSRYLNELYYDELREMDYTKTQKYLTKKQIEFLKNKLVIC